MSLGDLSLTAELQVQLMLRIIVSDAQPGVPHFVAGSSLISCSLACHTFAAQRGTRHASTRQGQCVDAAVDGASNPSGSRHSAVRGVSVKPHSD